jgi:hypothetical protein
LTSYGYWIAAVLLVPWIVVLAYTQPINERAHDLRFVAVGITVLAALAMVTTAALGARGSPYAVIAAAVAGTISLAIVWFHVLTDIGTSTTAALLVSALLFLPVVGLSMWVVLAPRQRIQPLTTWACLAYLVAATVAVILVIPFAVSSPPTQVAHNLWLVWTGLDVAEFLGIAATAWTLRRGSSRLAAAATVTGTLLCCDAWFNVTASAGTGQWNAIAMAGIELPFAAVSFLVALDSVRDRR